MARARGFSIIELLVVVGIISVLIGLLLVALGSVRRSALETKTLATLNSFQQAAQAFQLEHGFYPGVIPDRILSQDAQITNMENALLSMLGGYRLLAPQDAGTGNDAQTDYDDFTGDEIVFNASGEEWRLKVNRNKIGEGPVIDGKAFAPYFAPDETQLVTVIGQLNEPGNVQLPDLVDGWLQPIVYVRQSRTKGPLTGDLADQPQFYWQASENYTASNGIGDLQVSQDPTGNNSGSVLNLGGNAQKHQTWAKLLEHPALPGQARGGFMLMSAGADGVFLSGTDGPGSGSSPINSPAALDDITRQNVDEYDDVRLYGGG